MTIIKIINIFRWPVEMMKHSRVGRKKKKNRFECLHVNKFTLNYFPKKHCRAAKHFSFLKTNKLFSHVQDDAVRRKLLHVMMMILNHIFRAQIVSQTNSWKQAPMKMKNDWRCVEIKENVVAVRNESWNENATQKEEDGKSVTMAMLKIRHIFRFPFVFVFFFF